MKVCAPLTSDDLPGLDGLANFTEAEYDAYFSYTSYCNGNLSDYIEAKSQRGLTCDFSKTVCRGQSARSDATS